MINSADALSSPALLVRHEQLIRAFILIGLLARCIRYFLRFPLWEDECFLCVNFIDRGYAELLQPLNYQQVAPALFLWIELTMVKLFGYNELSLRLFGFICSIASLFLFRHVASRLLKGMPQLIAVGVFAVAYPGIRYAAEAKQYASDMLVGLVLLALAVEWWLADCRRTRQKLLWSLTAFIPLAMALSLPAVFAAGGVSLFIACVLIQQASSARYVESSERTTPSSGEWCVPKTPLSLRSILSDGQWIAWGTFNAVLVTCFAILMLLAAKDTNVAAMDHYWNYVFPPLTTPWRLPIWFLTIHTGELLAYPIGGGRGASALTFICIVCAIIALWKERRWSLLILMLASPFIHMTASALHRYPYGGHVKFSQHMAGIICLLCGIGTAALLSWLARRERLVRQVAMAAVLYLMVIGISSMTRDVLLPYKTESDMRARAFAEWFWFNAGFDSEVLCAKNDLGQNFCPKMYDELSWAAMYQCNKHIYSPQRPPVEQRLARVTTDHPLRCVVYRDPRYEFDQAAFDRWMNDMTSRYRLIGTETFAFPRFAKREEECRTIDYLDEYRFVPRQQVAVLDSQDIHTASRVKPRD